MGRTALRMSVKEFRGIVMFEELEITRLLLDRGAALHIKDKVCKCNKLVKLE